MSSRALLRILAIGVLAMLAILGWQLQLSYQTTLAQAEKSASNLALALDGQISAVLRRIDASLHALAQELPPSALQAQSVPRYEPMVRELLQSHVRNFPEVKGFYVWSATDGRLLYGSTPVQPGESPPTIGHRPGFAYLKANPEAAIAYSDAIRSSVTGLQTVAVYVPVRDERQQLLAVLTATLNLERIEQAFDSLQLPPRSVMYLRRLETHRVLVRHPAIEGSLNQSVRSIITDRIDAGATQGTARYPGRLDGEPRIYAFSQLEGYPFYVMVGLSEQAVMHSWRQNAALVATFVVGLGLALLLVIQRIGRLERQRLTAQQDAQQAHELLHDAINSISAGITIYGPDDRLVMNNAALLGIFDSLRDVLQPGRTFEEVTRIALQRGLYAEAVDDPEAWLARRLRQHQEADGRPYELALADGRWIEFSEHRTPKGYIVGSRIDITQRKRLEAELRELASTDELTGLANRRQFMQRLEEELERLRRKTTRAACVLMLDLDHFKRVNDQHGHAAGDRLLQHFAQLLRQELRSVDTPARMGGEEFAVILPGTEPAAAQGIAQRICERLAAQPFHAGAQQLHITVSVGVAALDAADLSADAVLARADAALYRAKAGGRNRVELTAG